LNTRKPKGSSSPRKTKLARKTTYMLSRRITKGNPTFKPMPGSDSCVAFEVTWNGVPSSANHFQGYAIRVLLTDEVEVGDLALVILPPAAGDHLQLMEIGEDGSFLDAQTFEPVVLEGIRVLGQVVEEREYLTPDQLNERREEEHRQPFFPDPEGIARFITVGMAQVKAEREEQDAAGEIDDVLVTCSAMVFSDAYQSARDAFRSDDANEPHWNSATDPTAVELYECDYGLRYLCAQFFRAGLLIGGSPTSRLATGR
jgi:hypothetical protein